MTGPKEMYAMQQGTPYTKRVCYYHAGCPDGAAAAYAVWNAWGDTDSQGISNHYIAAGHDDVADADLVTLADVVYVDMAPAPQELERVASLAKRVTVLDHHVSAKRRYCDDPQGQALLARLSELGHRIHIDMTHSGAILAWQHFCPQTPIPELLRYVEDQDLWRWKLPESRAINAALATRSHSLENWKDIAHKPIAYWQAQGAPLVEAQDGEINRALNTAHRIELICGRIEAANCTTPVRSRLGHAMAQRSRWGTPASVVYRISGRRVFVSIYSVGDLDVSIVAEEYGGGGHPNAAGFRIDLDDWSNLLT